jgi:hypothetical protein
VSELEDDGMPPAVRDLAPAAATGGVPTPARLRYTELMLVRAITALLAGALACNGPAADTGFASSQPGPTSTPGGSSTGANGASSSGDGDTTASPGGSEAGSTEPLRDLGGEPDFGPDKPLGCKGKIDFLFLISREWTMHEEQQQLLASFPGFIDTIETMFPEFDTHIMVANPEGTWGGWGCEKELCQNDAPYCGENGKDYVCGPASYELVTDCDEVLGGRPALQRGSVCDQRPVLTGRRPPLHRHPATSPTSLASLRVHRHGGDLRLPVPPTGDALIAALSPYLIRG